MKSKSFKYPLITVASFSLALAAQAQFTPGNLVVLQDGTGSAALSSAGTALFLDQFTTSGTLVGSEALPTTGANAFVNSGSAASEGQLSLSADGAYLVLAGYNVAAGTTGVASSSTIPRAIATVDGNGNFSIVSSSTTFYAGNNIRGGTSDGNGNFWGAGATGGTIYMGGGTPGGIVSSNSLAIQDIGGNLFYTTAKGVQGLWEISGNPTTGPVTPTLVIGQNTPSGFAFNSAMNLAYVANTAGGISKYSNVGGTWTLDYTLDSSVGINALAVDFSGVDPTIYATTELGTQLIDISDSGSGSLASILATAGTNEAFRGLEFAPTPVPEPSTLALAGIGGLVSLWSIRRRK